MRAKKRYMLLMVSCAFLAYCHFGGFGSMGGRGGAEELALQSYASIAERSERPPPGAHSNRRLGPIDPRSCRMESCFDFSRCVDRLPYVYVYPSSGPQSAAYRRLTGALRRSRYYTDDPSLACLFVTGVDTLDRDPLSPDYSHEAAARLRNLPHWNGGRNHLVFNLYAGTWPGYEEAAMALEVGEAMFARASGSWKRMRRGFDISLPLFNRDHPERGGTPPFVSPDPFPKQRKRLLVFKGKRYVHGVGSETRNSIWHLHDRERMVLLTTCRHGKSWRDREDDRCDEDDREYTRYDYWELLQNSTFCAVVRGRRLGSYRFLESLSSGCAPLILANGWRLPFDEVIDWRRTVLRADERLLLQVPDIVRGASSSPSKVLQRRQQAFFLADTYFSSIETIVFTTLEIIWERLPGSIRRDALMWNTPPGGLSSLPAGGDHRSHFPFFSPRPVQNFTALLYATQESGSLKRILKAVQGAEHAGDVVFLWGGTTAMSSGLRDMLANSVAPRPLQIFSAGDLGTAAPLLMLPDIQTKDAILMLDADAALTSDEMDFAFRSWQHFPDRIVGYPARNHYWDEAKGAWGYTSRRTNEYSMVLSGAAVVHRYYAVLYSALAPLLHKTVAQAQNCEDILLNCAVSHATRRPPIKLTRRKTYKQEPLALSPWNDPDHFVQRRACLNAFAAVFGRMPLLRSAARLDPLLYRDPVSNMRKRYRQIELVTS